MSAKGVLLNPSDSSYSPGKAAVVDSEPQSMLVVGGTDGSGTRSVVKVLADLGVTMVSEDPHTLDIHADKMGGWPPVVKQVLSSTHTLDYDSHALPDYVRTTIHS